MTDNQTKLWASVALTAITTIGAALGVQLSPAARPTEVSEALREELRPLAGKVDRIEAKVDAQDRRLTAVETSLSRDATSTKD